MTKRLHCAALATLLAGTAVSAPLPIESFARRPQMRAVTISADGRYISYLSGVEDSTVVMTVDRAAGGRDRRAATSDPDKFDIGWCRWANEKRLLCGIYGNIRGKKYAEPPFKRLFAMDADGKMRTLRQGTNGFTCMADSPATPGPDPMCMDKNAFAWAGAWMAHKDPPQGKVGFMYMLEGGTDASNTDPFAAKPTASNHWIKTGPHIMVVGADASFYDSYPKSPDPDTTQPYVMWAGTPYQHLMAPVR